MPVYIGFPLPFVAGSGNAPLYPAIIARFANSCGVRVVSSFVSRYAPVIKSRNAPIIGPPYLGEIN